jgi:hypothetical protein
MKTLSTHPVLPGGLGYLLAGLLSGHGVARTG